MRVNRISILSCIAVASGVLMPLAIAASPASTAPVVPLDSGQQATVRFYGSPTADLFTRELEDSLQGVLQKDFVAEGSTAFPVGFVNASPAGQPWAGTMWTRDSGTLI